MVPQATLRLIETASNASSTDADVQAAAQAFFQTLSRASLNEANAALATLAEAVSSLEDLSRAGFLALVCGALVEQGCDPAPLAPPLTERVRGLLEASAVLADACAARMPKSGGEEQDPTEAFENARRELASAMPRENTAWEALHQFWRPAIAVFSVSPAARQAARRLREPAARIAPYHEGGHWLALLLSVLDNEPILAIEPQTSLGVLARISGVVDNFQLNVLLMHAFPKSGFFSRRRVSRRAAEIARGLGPQQTDEVVTSVWNLYTWKAIEPSLKLPDPGDYGAGANWIWNEGVPEDIPVFEGRRVILLGPPSYPRSWQSQRMFDKLPARLEVERQLSTGEVKGWLEKMAAAKSAS